MKNTLFLRTFNVHKIVFGTVLLQACISLMVFFHYTSFCSHGLQKEMFNYIFGRRYQIVFQNIPTTIHTVVSVLSSTCFTSSLIPLGILLLVSLLAPLQKQHCASVCISLMTQNLLLSMNTQKIAMLNTTAQMPLHEYLCISFYNLFFLWFLSNF